MIQVMCSQFYIDLMEGVCLAERLLETTYLYLEYNAPPWVYDGEAFSPLVL